VPTTHAVAEIVDAKNWESSVTACIVPEVGPVLHLHSLRENRPFVKTTLLVAYWLTLAVKMKMRRRVPVEGSPGTSRSDTLIDL
jgi:hypothetical protein